MNAAREGKQQGQPLAVPCRERGPIQALWGPESSYTGGPRLTGFGRVKRDHDQGQWQGTAEDGVGLGQRAQIRPCKASPQVPPSLQGPPGRGCAWLTPSPASEPWKGSPGCSQPFPKHSAGSSLWSSRGLPTMPLAACIPVPPTPSCSPLSGKRNVRMPTPWPSPNDLLRKRKQGRAEAPLERQRAQR